MRCSSTYSESNMSVMYVIYHTITIPTNLPACLSTVSTQYVSAAFTSILQVNHLSSRPTLPQTVLLP